MDIDIKQVKDTWIKKGKKLKNPNIYLAVYYDKKYYVYRDDSFIIFMIPENCDITYALPKKYCKIKQSKDKNNYYNIENIENASVVSCIGRKNEYEKFILNNFIERVNCS
jgi:hypothetical protein